ncbi:hypothetical protein FACS189426_22360 [Bacteroidia bacterium]|nr:hypothetical protein FACS189426_22360 [Bacteroidia bacterium]GHV71933.1 hypothetical protein FACS189420_8430 [Bacteroidia bacterium]
MLAGCNNKGKEQVEIGDLPKKTITIHPSDITKEEIGDFFTLDSYIILSNKEVFGEIRRIVMVDSSIYILDHTSRFFCYDMTGHLKYIIDKRGQGPQEYLSIEDFGVDQLSNKLFIYDDLLRKLFIFDKNTGDYISEISTKYMLPEKMGIIDGTFFFSCSDNRRVTTKKEQRFHLFYSESGEKIDDYYLPHDAFAEFHFGLLKGYPFYYNENKLFFNIPFDSRVYLLNREQIDPLYDIYLPNQLPKKQIEDKINHIDLVRSDYAYGLSNIFETGQKLCFTFTKDGFYNTCFYDLTSDKVLFCGPRALGTARKNVLFFSLINGVYDGKFYALVPPGEIIEKRETHPEFFSEDLMNISFGDNCVIAFYKVF